MASPFASLSVSDPIPLPFDDGQTVTIRKLTAGELTAAVDAHRNKFLIGNSRVWPASVKEILEKGLGEALANPQTLAALRNPLNGYDRFALVKSGLVAWSYNRPVAPEAIEDLDDEAVDFIATEVLRRTKPALFHATEEAAAEEKKRGLELSTVT